MRIMAVCSTGLGSSFMIELKVKEVLKEMGVEAEVEHTDLGSVTSDMADVFVCTHDLAGSLGSNPVIAIPNITDKEAMRQSLTNYFNTLAEE
ncbi:PTS sugar transporter subunit IIB [Vibrio sp. SA48]|uniref:PTS sugar transporter subunit IIB n=1 Tax=unclassified Vibrio TaxID=2614977 RepID=UPI0017818817|nr:PTS sugar transporter subunit IIB [Vibrio sp. S12_S33]MBD1567301.1 PTS sugar transporter subunit IIB [Vibrio sp. S12_S33]